MIQQQCLMTSPDDRTEHHPKVGEGLLRRLLRFLFPLAYVVALTGFAPQAESNPERWVVYYGDKEPAERFRDYGLIVLDRDFHPSLEPLRREGRTILGYVSLGEAETFRSDYSRLIDAGLVIKHNPLWKDHSIIDLRRPEWTEHLISTVIPQVIAKGFDGIMLDTVDSPLELEAEDPNQFSGMADAAIRILRTLRARFPQLTIMLNRGFEILPAVSDDIDLVLAENLYTDWQPGEAKPMLVPQSEYLQALNTIKGAIQRAPHLKVYTVDYWPETDHEGRKKIYRAMRDQGFVPYVASIDLQSVQPEPR